MEMVHQGRMATERMTASKTCEPHTQTLTCLTHHDSSITNQIYRSTSSKTTSHSRIKVVSNPQQRTIREVSSLSKIRALIVDDDETSRILLCSLLESIATCQQCDNGLTALELMRSSLEQKKPYDLVFMDIRMPGLDGHKTLKKIRALEKEFSHHCPKTAKVVMTTILHDYDSIMQSFENKCSVYLVKPIDKTTLFEQIKRLGFHVPG